jgi:two-component system sensor histidine kinase/response regulator
MFDDSSAQIAFLYRIFNLLIGVASVSLAGAFAWSGAKRREQRYRWIYWLFAAFFLSLAAGRIVRAYANVYEIDMALRLAPDAIGAVLGLLIGTLVWPMVRYAVTLPAREELQSTVQELRVAQKELERARDKAIESSTLKSAFVANISHEVRTPLSGIIGMNELLLASDLDEYQRELATTAHQSSRQLLVVLNDILDISKIEAGRMILETVSFCPGEVIRDAIRLMQPAAVNKGLVLKEHTDFVLDTAVLGDPHRFRQIVLDLLSNAIKFTDFGEVTIESTVEQENSGSVTLRFVVSDTGVGIAEADQTRLFQPFSQADNSSTRRFGGTGLGLTISKHLVEMMGGKIGVRSTYGVGSSFWFVIPFKKTVDNESPSQTDSISASGIQTMKGLGARVLVAEDNPILQQLIQKQLSILGIKSRIVSAGEDAVREAQTEAYDLVLMDCSLEGMSGQEATAQIREAERRSHGHLPIVALTAGISDAEKDRCRTAGMDDVLLKPIAIADLSRAIDRWITPEKRRLA